MNLRQAAQQALEALKASRRSHHYCEDTWYSCPKHEDGCANELDGDECNCGADEENEKIDKAITALKQALAEPEQKPVAWYCNQGLKRGVSLKQESPEWMPLYTALAEPEQEPVATKQMLRWVEHLKRLSDDGQHMSIPGLSSGACWELAIELEQFIKNTAPTPRKPLTDEEMPTLFVGGLALNSEATTEIVRAVEKAHGIGEQQ